MLLLCLFYFGAIPGGAQGLILALNSGVIPGGAQIIWDAEDQNQVCCVQDKYLTFCSMTLALYVNTYCYLEVFQFIIVSLK